jgi:hypothetical protein
VEGAGQVVVQVEGRFQCDEVQFRNGSTRIRVDYRCEVTTIADGVFVKGFEQNVQASRIHGRDSGQAYHKLGVVIAARFGDRISQDGCCVHVYLADCGADCRVGLRSS